MNENNKTFTKMLWSYIIIIIIPIFILGFLTIAMLFSKLAADTKKLNQDKIERSAEMVDDEILKILNLFFQMEEKDAIQSVVNENLYNNNSNKYTLYEITNELQMLKNNSSMLKCVGFYIKDANLVVTDDSASILEEFHETNFNSTEFPYEELKKQFELSMRRNKFISWTNVADEECVMLYKRMKVASNRKIVTVFAIVDKDIIIAKTKPNNAGFEFAMTDMAGNVIIISDGFNVDDKKENQKISVKSSVMDVEYTYYMSQGAFTGSVYSLMLIFSVFVFLTILVSAVLAYLNMQKIKRLFMVFFSKNKDLEESLSQQRETSKERTLVNILHNIGLHETNNNERMQSCGIYFPKKYFAVMTVSSVQTYEQESYSSLLDSAWNELNQLVKSGVLKLGMNCEIVRTGNNLYSYILNFAEQRESQKIKAMLCELMTNYNIALNFGIGQETDNIEKLYLSYEKSVSALRHGIIKEPSRIVYYEEIQGVENNKIYYTDEKEKQLIRCINMGLKDEVKVILDEIHKVNFKQRHISYGAQKRLIYILSLTIYNVLDENCEFDSEMYEEYSKNCEHLFRNDDVEDCFSTLCEICLSLCDSLGKQTDEDTIKDRIIDYINKNYNDYSMSLETLAKHLNISYYYLSRMFKEYLGTNFISYITLTRMEKAKELLKETEDSVEEIAIKTGFINVKSFVRVFKKYYNTTPIKFRKM